MDNNSSDITETITTSFRNTAFTISDILERYFDILEMLAESIEESTDARKVAKFCEIRQEMFEFAAIHNNLFKLEKIKTKTSGKELFDIELSNYNTAEQFLNYEKFLLLHRKKVELQEDCKSFVVNVKFQKLNIIDFIVGLFLKPMSKLKAKSVCSLEDLWPVTDVKWKNTGCSIKDLSKKLARRFEDFRNDTISNERIEELSFTLDVSTSHLVTDQQCSVCLDCLKENQELCRMPCGHCFHKQCIENWFYKENESLHYNEYSDEESIADSLELIYSQNNIVEPIIFRSVEDTESSSEDEKYEDLVNATAHLSITNTGVYEVTSEQDVDETTSSRNSTEEKTPSSDNTEATTHSIDNTEATTSLRNVTEAITESSCDDDECDSETDVDDYDSDGFDETFDPYDLDVQDSEIDTKTQCPVCRSYCW